MTHPVLTSANTLNKAVLIKITVSGPEAVRLKSRLEQKLTDLTFRKISSQIGISYFNPIVDLYDFSYIVEEIYNVEKDMLGKAMIDTIIIRIAYVND